MKNFFIIALILIPALVFADNSETGCAFQDDIVVDFLGLTSLVSIYYEKYERWPSSLNDLKMLEQRITDAGKALKVVKQKFENVRFVSSEKQVNIQLTYIAPNMKKISGTLVMPKKKNANLMIQNVRVEGDLKKILN